MYVHARYGYIIKMYVAHTQKRCNKIECGFDFSKADEKNFIFQFSFFFGWMFMQYIRLNISKEGAKKTENCSNILYYWIVKNCACMQLLKYNTYKCKLLYVYFLFRNAWFKMNSIFHHLLLWAFSLTFLIYNNFV